MQVPRAARRWTRRASMRRTSAAIGELVERLALDPAERRVVQARVARYSRECGCAFGGACMVAALAAAGILLALEPDFTFASVAACIGGVLAAGIVGKALGLLGASLRLAALQASLERRYRRNGAAGVDLH